MIPITHDMKEFVLEHMGSVVMTVVVLAVIVTLFVIAVFFPGMLNIAKLSGTISKLISNYNP